MFQRPTVCVLCLASLVSHSQTRNAAQFEVATVKSALSPEEYRALGRDAPRSRVDPAQLYYYANVSSLVRLAYTLKPYQKLTIPEWTDSRWVEIAAKLPEGSNRAQIPEMLRALLSEQFRMVARRQPEKATVYNLVVGESGLKLNEAQTVPANPGRWKPAEAPGKTTIVGTTTSAGYIYFSRVNGSFFVLDANRISLAELAEYLERELDAPVVDKTSLNRHYEISLPVSAQWLARATDRAPDPSMPSQPAEPTGVNLFKSLDKLGLRLEKAEAEVDRLIVSHIEQGGLPK